MVGLSSRVGAELGRGGGGAWSALMLRASSYGDALVDLGQGKPNFQGSLAARSCAAEFVMGDVDGGKANQYCQIQGGAELLDSLVHFYTRHFGMSLEKSNVIITAGGTQALNTLFITLLNEGDEVLIIEPFFPWYPSTTRLCGAKPVYVSTSIEGRFWPTIEEIEAKITDKSKLLIFSNPSNPAGRVVTAPELEALIEMCKRRKILLVSDEAYEGQCWSSPHVKSASVLPEESKDILITLGTASKLCSLTGWRVGWIIAPAAISAACKLVHSHETYCAPVVLQRGIAESLDAERGDIEDHMKETAALMQRNASCLCDALEKHLGLTVFRPGGGYFVIADVSKFEPPASTVAADSADPKTDVGFVEWLLANAKVFCMPGWMFFDASSTKYVRFAISKTEAAVDEGIRRIAKAMHGGDDENGILKANG